MSLQRSWQFPFPLFRAPRYISYQSRKDHGAGGIDFLRFLTISKEPAPGTWTRGTYITTIFAPGDAAF